MLLGQSKENILRLMDAGELKVSIYGLGRVGLPLAVAWLRAGQKVIGADIDLETVTQINKGLSPFQDEPQIPQAVEYFVRDGRFIATTDLIKASENSDVKFITVPTTTSKKGFDAKALELALRKLGRGLKKRRCGLYRMYCPPYYN